MYAFPAGAAPPGAAPGSGKRHVPKLSYSALRDSTLSAAVIPPAQLLILSGPDPFSSSQPAAQSFANFDAFGLSSPAVQTTVQSFTTVLAPQNPNTPKPGKPSCLLAVDNT